jgi:hypothetical protein
MVCILWEKGPNLTSLYRSLGNICAIIPVDETATPTAWIELLRADDTRLLVHVNLGRMRSRQNGLDLVKQLRWEWGVTAPILFLSFEEEEKLRVTSNGDLLTQPGHGFLRLPATKENIQRSLQAVTPVIEPWRYQRSAAVASLVSFLDGPAFDPINDGPGLTISLLDYWQNGVLDRMEVVDYIKSNQWWQRWSETLSNSKKRLVGLSVIPDECLELLGRIEESLSIVTNFVEKVLDLSQQSPVLQNLIKVSQALEVISETVYDLTKLRDALKS